MSCKHLKHPWLKTVANKNLSEIWSVDSKDMEREADEEVTTAEDKDDAEEIKTVLNSEDFVVCIYFLKLKTHNNNFEVHNRFINSITMYYVIQ